MAAIWINYETLERGGRRFLSTKRSDLEVLCPSIFNSPEDQSGNVKPTRYDAVAAVLDLEGFTDFCDAQREPQLSIPRFVDAFLDWLFKEMKSQFVRKNRGDDVVLWCRFPYVVKYTGDGLLLILGCTRGGVWG